MLTVKIIRNFQAPVFDVNSQFITRRIPEDTTSQVVIATLTATDADRQAPNNITRYRYRESDKTEDSTYFRIDPVSGDIRVDKALWSDTRPNKNTYTVSCSCSWDPKLGHVFLDCCLLLNFNVTNQIMFRICIFSSYPATSYQRRCDVVTSHRCRSDVILTSCACWVLTFIFAFYFK